MGKTSIFSTAFLFVCLFLFSSTKQNKKILFSCTYIFSLSGKGKKSQPSERKKSGVLRRGEKTQQPEEALVLSAAAVSPFSPPPPFFFSCFYLFVSLLLLLLLLLFSRSLLKVFANTAPGLDGEQLRSANFPIQTSAPPPFPPPHPPPPSPPPPLLPLSPSLPPSLLAAGLRLQGPRANQRRAAWELANDITAGQWRRSPDLIWFLLRF